MYLHVLYRVSFSFFFEGVMLANVIEKHDTPMKSCKLKDCEGLERHTFFFP